MTNGQSWVFSLNHSTADNHVNNTITLRSNMHCTAHVPLRHNMYLVKCTQAYLHRVPFPHMCPTTLPADWAYSSAGSLKSIRGRRCRLGPPPRATIVGREGGGAGIDHEGKERQWSGRIFLWCRVCIAECVHNIPQDKALFSSQFPAPPLCGNSDACVYRVVSQFVKKPAKHSVTGVFFTQTHSQCTLCKVPL